MTYRDESEALRARVEKLEEENRELHERLEPKPKAPEAAPAPSSDEAPSPASGRRVFTRVARATSWIFGLAIVLGGGLYLCSSDCKIRHWDGNTPFEC